MKRIPQAKREDKPRQSEASITNFANTLYICIKDRRVLTSFFSTTTLFVLLTSYFIAWAC